MQPPTLDNIPGIGETAMDRRKFLSCSAVAMGGVLMATAGEGLAASAPNTDDRIVIDGLDTSTSSEEFIGLLRQGGVNCVHKSLGDAYSYGQFLRFVDQHTKDVTVARSVGEILQAKRDGKIAFVCGSQAASEYMAKLLSEDADQKYEPIADALRTTYELGLRTQGICYNLASVFGGGCLQPTIPLTRAGQRLVEEIHKLRILLDVGGHTGEQTSLDALAMSAGVPVVCTHTNVAALNPNLRATSDRVLEGIAKSSGVIGLTAVSDFLVRNASSVTQGPRSPQATLDVLLDQYDYLKRLVGIDHVGLGPDFIWGWGNTYSMVSEDNMVFPTDVMSSGPPQVVKDFENISKLPNLEHALANRGWTKPELNKLLGANWLRVYKSAWGA